MKKEKEFENIALKCMENICKYYNKDIKIIEEFKKIKQDD